MAGGGAFYLNFDTGQCKISFNPFISVEKDDVVQCCIPYGRWWCSLFEFWHWVNAKYHLNHHKQCTGAFTNWVWCSPYERWVDFRSGFTLSELQWGGFLLNWLNLANPSGYVNANQVLMLNFSLSLKSHWQPCDSFMPVSEYRRMI